MALTRGNRGPLEILKKRESRFWICVGEREFRLQSGRWWKMSRYWSQADRSCCAAPSRWDVEGLGKVALGRGRRP